MDLCDTVFYVWGILPCLPYGVNGFTNIGCKEVVSYSEVFIRGASLYIVYMISYIAHGKILEWQKLIVVNCIVNQLNLHDYNCASSNGQH